MIQRQNTEPLEEVADIAPGFRSANRENVRLDAGAGGVQSVQVDIENRLSVAGAGIFGQFG